jgi:signal transduction histidine kinase
VLGDLKSSNERYKKFSSLGKFAGGLVHEINNPLDGVIRFINLSLDNVSEDDVVREYLLESKKGLSRIAQFVRSLLNFSWSLSSPGTEMDITRSIEESLFYCGHHLKSYNITVEKSYSDKLATIADRGLKIVFNNLIKNAIEAMKQQGGGTLTIATASDEGGIEIVFSDTGKGIPKNIQEKIFDPFFTTKNIGQGSGLGLAIAYEIIERYQGTISVKSEEGKGATFSIRIPAPSRITLENLK